MRNNRFQPGISDRHGLHIGRHDRPEPDISDAPRCARDGGSDQIVVGELGDGRVAGRVAAHDQRVEHLRGAGITVAGIAHDVPGRPADAAPVRDCALIDFAHLPDGQAVHAGHVRIDDHFDRIARQRVLVSGGGEIAIGGAQPFDDRRRNAGGRHRQHTDIAGIARLGLARILEHVEEIEAGDRAERLDADFLLAAVHQAGNHRLWNVEIRRDADFLRRHPDRMQVIFRHPVGHRRIDNDLARSRRAPARASRQRQFADPDAETAGRQRCRGDAGRVQPLDEETFRQRCRQGVADRGRADEAQCIGRGRVMDALQDDKQNESRDRDGPPGAGG